MFNRSKQEEDPENHSEPVPVQHTETAQEPQHETLITSTTSSINFKLLIKNVIFLTLITLALQLMTTNNYNPAILLNKLRSFIYSMFHDGQLPVEDAPIIGSVEFDTVESNPINLIRLLIVIIVCLSLTIPFLV